MFVDLFHTKKLRLALVYIAFLIIVQFMQDTVMARFAVLGVKTLFVPAAVTAVGFHEGGFRGGIYGLLAGLLCDMTYAENTVMFTLLVPALGFGSGLAADFALNRSYVAYMFTAFVCLLITGGVQMLRVLVLQPGALLHCLLTALGQTVLSMPIAALLYFPAEQISTRFEA